MYAVRTKKVASYGRRAQRYVAVSEDRRFGTNSCTETPTQQSDWSPPASISVYSPSPAKVDQRKSARKVIGKMTGKGRAVRRPLGVLPSNHQASPLVPPKTSMSKKPYSSVGNGTPLSLRQFSPFVEVEISVIDGAGRKVSEEKRRTNMPPSFKATAQKPASTPPKRFRKTIQMLVDSDDDSDFVPSPVPSRIKNPAKKTTGISPAVHKRKSTQVQSTTRVQIPETPESTFTNSSPDMLPKSRLVRKAFISDSESEASSDVNPLKPMPKVNTIAPRKQQAIKSPSSIPKPPPLPALTFPQSPCKVPTLATGDHAPPTTSTTKFLTPFPLFKLQDHHADDPPALDANARPLTPMKPNRPKNSFGGPSNLPDEDTDISISLDVSIDLELELALKIAQVNLRDFPRTGTLDKAAVTEKKPVVPGTSIPSKTSRASASSQLRPSLKKKIPSFLRPLLNECGQEAPYDFREFVEVFPFDQIHSNSNGQRTSLNPLPVYQKVGEASYSEVFGIGDVVLKVIPLMDEDNESNLDNSAELPSMSEARDVIKEIIVTRAMGNMCDGFTTLLRSHVVQGSYPETFLSLWDEYNDRKGSESVRPDTFPSFQSYVIIILPHGGQDLEALSFDSDICWRQASSVFWQVAKSLATAEELVHFEHRDLHWGQILVSKHQRKRDVKDSSTFDVRATIIDLGLARIDYVSEGNVGDVCWTPFAEEIFQGEGDYQYDVYRMMREHNKNEWKPYNPLTNVMWLHYLCDKLIRKKKLKVPPASSRSASTQSTRSGRKGVLDAPSRKLEMAAYDGLVAVESTLSEVISSIAQKAARKTKPTQGRKPSKNAVETAEKLPVTSAQDVLKLAKSRGWMT